MSLFKSRYYLDWYGQYIGFGLKKLSRFEHNKRWELYFGWFAIRCYHKRLR